MEQKEDLAIILQRKRFSERHLIVTAITAEHGRVSAIARNAIQSRRFGSTLELFTASLWTFSDKNEGGLLELQQAAPKRSYEGLREHLEKLSLGSVWTEIILRLAPERAPCPELFKLHANSLAVLEDSKLDPESQTLWVRLLTIYIVKILQWSGNQPQLEACQKCKIHFKEIDPEASLFGAIEEASWRCSDCATDHHHPLSKVAIVDYFQSMTHPIRQASELIISSDQELLELHDFLERLMIYHVPGFDEPLKSLRLLRATSFPNAKPSRSSELEHSPSF